MGSFSARWKWTLAARLGGTAGALLISLLLSGGLAIAAGPAAERPLPRSTTTPGETRRELREKRKEISQQIVAITDRQAKNDGALSDDDAEQLALLRSIDAVEFHHQSLLEQQSLLEAELADADKRLAKLDEFAPNEPKPYSFLLLEGLKDQLAEQQREEAALKTDLKSAEQLLAAAHDELDHAARRRRAASGAAQPDRADSAKSSVESDKADAGKAEIGSEEVAHSTDSHQASDKGLVGEQGSAARQLGLQFAVTLAREKVALGRTNVEVAKLRVAANSARQKQLAKKIAVVEKEVEFTAQDRDTELARLAALEADLDHRRIVAETRFHRLELQTKPAGPVTPGLRQPTEEQPELRAAAEFYNATLLLLDQGREQLDNVRKLWRDRYELAHAKVSDEQAGKWLDAVNASLAGLDDWSKSWEHRFNALSDEPIDSAERGDSAQRPGADANAPEGAFRDFSGAYAAARREARHDRQGLERFRDELKARLAAHAGRGATVAAWLRSVWNWEVLSDEKESVTLGKLFVLLSYILAGLLLAYSASWLVGGRLLRRLGWHRGKAAALKSILFYALCVFFGALAFRVLRVPLGAFAFLGGAAAIAVGFGSQDIMNNFMSGIILLTEQPIRVGDIIELGGEQAQVTYIGLRSTRLLTEANHELIVANKMLLDEQVKNLTLTDRFVQLTVTVDLDRNLPVAKTKRRILELAFSHPLVLKTNRPIVLLTEVDSYALRFQVLFWVEHRSFIKCAIVQSEVLEMITAEFPAADGEPPPESETIVSESTNHDETVESDSTVASDGELAAGDDAVGAANRPARKDDRPGQSAAALGRPSELSRDVSASIRKMSRAAIQKEIRRAGLK